MEANARYVIRRSTPKEATALVERLAPQFPLGFIEERQMTVRQGAEDPTLVVIDSECQYLDLLGLDSVSVNEASRRANWVRAELLLLSNLPELEDIRLLYTSEDGGEDLSLAVPLDEVLWAMLTEAVVGRRPAGGVNLRS